MDQGPSAVMNPYLQKGTEMAKKLKATPVQAERKDEGNLRRGLKKRGEVYHYRFQLNGRLIVGSTGCFDRASAELFLLRLKSSLALEGVDVRKKKKVTFGECFKLWESAKAPRVAPQTLNMFMSHWRRNWSAWKDIPLEELQPKIDELYQTYRIRYAPASQREMLVKLSGILEFARTRCLHNIPFDIPQIYVPRYPKPVMDQDEISQFFEQLDLIANLHQKVMVRAMYHLALRCHEAYELRWDRYNEKAMTYTVEGKGGKIETIPVPKEMAEWFAKLPRLGRYMCPRDGSDSPHGEKYTDAVVKRAAAAIGHHEWSHHRLRASMGTNMANSGAHIQDVARTLRHSSVETTKAYYIEHDMNALRAAMERVIPRKSHLEPEPESNIQTLNTRIG